LLLLLSPFRTHHVLLVPHSFTCKACRSYTVITMPLSSPVMLRAPIARARARSPLHHHSSRCTPIRNSHLPQSFLKFSTVTSSLLCNSGSDVAFAMSVEGVLYIFAQNGYMKLLPKQSLFALNSTCKKVSKITSTIVSSVLCLTLAK
jgi:hypothetical protein